MQITNEFEVGQPIDAVWEFFGDIPQVASCLPGTELTEELGPDRVRVNTVVPTWMWGPNVELYCRWQAGERGVSVEEVKAEIESRLALREMPDVMDVAEAVVFFASDRSRMITGQSLLVNAGDMYPVA